MKNPVKFSEELLRTSIKKGRPGGKPVSRRESVGEFRMNAKVIHQFESERGPKGDVLPMPRFAGMMSAKRMDRMISFCHPLKLDIVDISFHGKKTGILIQKRVSLEGKTIVEMEALSVQRN